MLWWWFVLVLVLVLVIVLVLVVALEESRRCPGMHLRGESRGCKRERLLGVMML
jgi:hypothetical protein